MFTEIEVASPGHNDHMHTSTDVAHGISIPALKRLQIIDPDSWEDLTLELVSHWKTEYPKVVRCGGGGDMGRDVIAYMGADLTQWENFQCKHYNQKLNLSQALLEIGKHIYYSFKGEFSLPVKYYFVSPLGVSTDLLNHLMDSGKLRNSLIARWDKDCKSRITSKGDGNVNLTDALRSFIYDVDFTIFDHIPPIKIIELHAMTQYHAIRFGAPIRKRPVPSPPPEELADVEVVYTKELLAAFGDAQKKTVQVGDLPLMPEHDMEYKSARRNFYSAENLEKFSRDWLPGNSYGELMDECYESVSSVVRSKHENGYSRYLATCTQASVIDYQSHPLRPYMKVQDKKGMCHQLVNMKKLKWVKDE